LCDRLPGEDGVGVWSREEVAAVVPAVDEGSDGVDKVTDRVEAAAADSQVMMPKKISTCFTQDPLVG